MKTPSRRIPLFGLAAAMLLALAPALQALPEIKVLATGGTIAGAQTSLVVIAETFRELTLNQRFHRYATTVGFRIRAC